MARRALLRQRGLSARQALEAVYGQRLGGLLEGDDQMLDAVSVFVVGEVAVGRDAIMAALAPYFEAKVATWSWTEITRSEQGCRTGVIVYRTLAERPGLCRHAINTVTYTFDRGRWLVISDQGTEVSPPTSG